jgi:hypothetical protein
VLRCDAGAGPCAPAELASVTAPAHVDPAPPGEVVWYRLAAVNACGRTD